MRPSVLQILGCTAALRHVLLCITRLIYLIAQKVTCVQGGFIWLFYGPKSLPEEERPPIPYVPELDDPTWQPVYGDIEFECNHW